MHDLLKITAMYIICETVCRKIEHSGILSKSQNEPDHFARSGQENYTQKQQRQCALMRSIGSGSWFAPNTVLQQPFTAPEKRMPSLGKMRLVTEIQQTFYLHDCVNHKAVYFINLCVIFA